MKVNKKLIEKYNKPVPRYTSYPPANFFHENFTEADFRQAIEASNSQGPGNISIYIHIPFCNKLCFYCGCNSTPMAEKDIIRQYIEALKTEINLVIPYLDKTRKISQVHYGGGTPNSIDAEYLKEINDIFFQNFILIEKAEIAIECHPAYLDKEYISKLKEAGFNRFSLGIQDFNESVLKNVNRNPSLLPVDKIIELIKKEGNISVNLDFIYGLPGQTVESFKKSLLQALELRPDRLVTFSYAHVPWVNKAQKTLEKKGLPDPDEKINMYEMAYNLLTNNGYASIGMDHYVLKTDELFKAQQSGSLHRNFQGYCTRETTGQVYAFGVSGISQLQEVYSQNTKSVNDYIKLLSDNTLPTIKGYKLTKEEQQTRTTITQLMCNKYLNLSGADLSVKHIPDELIQDGIIELVDNQLRVTENGMLFIRNVAALFDPLLRRSNKTFSKSV